MQSKYVNILLQMGLSVNEAKVYLALLEKGISQVIELVTPSEVPQQKIYSVMQKLLNKGLCSLIPGKVKKYKPEKPETVISEFITDYEKQITSAKNLIIELESQYQRGLNNTNIEHIEIIKNKRQIAEKMIYLEKKAREEVLSFNKPPYAMTKRNVEEIKGLKRGVKYKSIYQTADLKEVIGRSVVEMYMKGGEEVKVASELPIKMMIFDSKIALFTLEESVTQLNNFSTVVIRNSDLVKVLIENFNTYWQNAMTYKEFINKEKISIQEFIEKDKVTRNE
ncbi:MAG: hypothetical protein K8R49_06270 [Candidatus Cloacimonetes bacterium]|nr:hypothetical protein [Candidatus Cloacimonadota bacterium]